MPLILTYDARGNGDGKTVNTITGDHNNRVTDYTRVICEPVYCLQGNGIERSDTAGCCGKGWAEDKSYTLNTMDRHAVAYCVGNGQADQLKLSEKVGASNCMHDQQCVIEKVWSLDRAAYNQGENAKCDFEVSDKGIAPTIVARGPSAVAHKKDVQYIVRRLCPVECARLQGFPDTWGHPDHKDDLTDEEYAFWLKVRNDWAAINGKKVKEYTKEQVLKWYNGLHTDSAEYEMWGNGIALPNALYVMEGIAEVLRRRKNETYQIAGSFSSGTEYRWFKEQYCENGCVYHKENERGYAELVKRRS